jgi:predicted ATPase
MGAEMAIPTFQVLLGEVYKAKEAFRKALTSVEEGLAVAAHNNDHHYDAGLYRLKGELLLETSKRNRVDNFIEAEACFKFAVDITRKQKARSVELRAVMRLARLWQVTGKKRDTYQMLERVYRKFTEGFDTPDLKQAKALLDELA